MGGRIKAPGNCRNRIKGLPLRDDCLPKAEIFAILGLGSLPREILHSQADPCARRLHQVSYVNRSNESTLRGENADFGLVSKFSGNQDH